jgi:hypothetical protein
MKNIILLLAVMIMIPSLALAQTQTNVPYVEPTIVYSNETCPTNSNCMDVRVLVDIINISVNTTRLDVPFSIYGSDTRLTCNLFTQDNSVHCTWDAPGSVWPDILFNKPIPTPSDEVAKVETYWNNTNNACMRDDAFKSSVIIWGVIILVISVCSLWLYLRWKKYGTRGR